MARYRIRGGKPLFGELQISGAKNAAVAIIPAAVMSSGICRIENIPQISDVTMFLNILSELGADIKTVNKHTMDIDCSKISSASATFDAMRKIRASYYLLGALLGRYGEAEVAMPGGCNFGGVRPIDQHIKGLRAMGAEIEIINNGIIRAKAKGGRLKGADIYLDVVSVGATINLMLAGSMAEGTTVLENVAREPHIVDLANFLNSIGADIRGAGTNVIKIRGKNMLTGGTYAMIPDQIEAGTYLAAVAGTGGEVLIKNVIPKHLDCITGKLEEMGVEVENKEDAVLIRRTGPIHRTRIKTLPYPGFPTDMQPQFAAVLCLADGTSTVTEGVWENRYRYMDELAKMGANVQVDGRVAIIEGVDKLVGAPVQAYDLRAGAAMVIAGLCAEGITEVSGIEYVERGYEDIVEKLTGIGADIEYVEDEEDKETVKEVG